MKFQVGDIVEVKDWSFVDKRWIVKSHDINNNNYLLHEYPLFTRLFIVGSEKTPIPLWVG